MKQKQDKDKIEVEKNKILKESNKQQNILNNDIQIKSANNSGWGGIVSTKPKIKKPLVVQEEKDKLQLNVNTLFKIKLCAAFPSESCSAVIELFTSVIYNFID